MLLEIGRDFPNLECNARVRRGWAKGRRTGEEMGSRAPAEAKTNMEVSVDTEVCTYLTYFLPTYFQSLLTQ